ncbi:MAG TPA: DNA replication/repair protein RecF [Fimbriimonas sp.]
MNETPATNRVARVWLEGFRNYGALDLEISPAFNVMTGRNAQGKTNFLEALYLLSTTRLLRGQRDAEAIQEGRQFARVEAELSGSGTRVAVTLQRGARKKAYLNGLGLPRASDLLGRIPCVAIGAEDMEIVRGEPSDRRLFLDLELSSLFPSYLRHLTLYKRALEQRNALLRSSQEFHQPAELFEPWEAQLAHHGAALREARHRYVRRIVPEAAALHSRLGQGEEISLTYLPKDPSDDEASLGEALGRARGLDSVRGGTSVGPHRDDLTIEVGGREARLFGSQGQQRTSVISLKLATLSIAAEELGSPPLLLLDDILSDLDELRRALLIEIVLAKAGQAILTCTEAAAAGERILQQAQVFEVVDGKIRR